jgi:hypothetical protein
MAIKHAKVATTPDDGTSEVGSGEWNEPHTLDGEGVPLVVGTTDPATPAAGTLLMYAKLIAGRSMPKFIGPSGVDNPFQPALWANRVMMVYPGSGTTIGSEGMTPTTAATLSHPALATTSLGTSIYRTQFTTTTTAGNASGLRAPTASIVRGNGTTCRGGFFANFRIVQGSLHTNGVQKMFGLSSSTAALAGEPSSSMADFIGMCLDSTDTTWQFSRRTGTGTATKINLGVTPAANQVFDMTLFSLPGGSEIFVRILQYADDGTATVLLDTSYNTSIPAATTFLGYHCQVRNGALAAAHNIQVARIYVESDF